jgi:hypothetical protein
MSMVTGVTVSKDITRREKKERKKESKKGKC